MEHIRLYNELAYLWPVISPPEDYAEEAKHWRKAIRAHLGPGRHHLLELGVGGGHNLSHLTNYFQATAVDISPKMLDISRQLNPDVDHHLGDMRTIRLARKFDAVLIHDAIAYMLTDDDLRATFATAREHLREGGLLLVAPDLVRDDLAEGTVLTWSSKKGDIEVEIEERITDPDPSDTQVESLYTYTIKEGGVERVELDTHTSGLFPIATWIRLFEEAGFKARRLQLPGHEGYGQHLFCALVRQKQL